MVPESRNGLLCHSIIVVTAAVVGEHGEFLFLHHIGGRLGLNTAPNIPNVSFKHLSNSWRDLPILIVLGYLERVCHRQLIRTHSFDVRFGRWVLSIRRRCYHSLLKEDERRVRRRAGN